MAFVKKENTGSKKTESLFEAISKQDEAEVNRWLTEQPWSLHSSEYADNMLLTPLDFAAIKGNTRIASLIARQGGTITKKNLPRIQTSPEMKDLLKNVKFTKNGYMPPRNPYSQSRDLTIFECLDNVRDERGHQLLESYINYDPSSVNDQRSNRSALSYALYGSSARAVQILLQNGATVSKERALDDLIYTSQPEDLAIEKMKILGSFGFTDDPKICTKALLLIIGFNYSHILKLKIADFMLGNLPIDWDYVSLHEVALLGSTDAIDLLCRHGKEKITNQIFADGYTLMHHIALGSYKGNPLQLLEILFRYNASPILRQYTTKRTAYQVARLCNHHDIAERIKHYTQNVYQGKIESRDTIEEQDQQIERELQVESMKKARLEPGVNLGEHFEIDFKTIQFETFLGRGGFGEVSLARWQNTPVAVKTLRGSYTAETVKAFLEEAKLFHLLRHKNILQMYGICREPVAIVMEYMPRGSLYSVLHSTDPLDWNVRYKFCVDVARGLSYLHSKHIVHRDLKSLNVLISNSMEAKLGDFGLARIKQAASLTTAAVGTAQWMAPELFDRHPNYSFASDVYSLGVVFWEVSTREVPWKDTHVFAVANLVLSNQREAPPPADTPVEIQTLINLCWHNEVRNRPSAQKVVDYLEGDLKALEQKSSSR